MEIKLVHYVWFDIFANVAIGVVQSGKQPFAKLCGDDKASTTSETVNDFNRYFLKSVNRHLVNV